MDISQIYDQIDNKATNDNAASLVNWTPESNNTFKAAQAQNQPEVQRTGFTLGAVTGGLIMGAVGVEAAEHAAVAGAVVGTAAGLGVGALIHHSARHFQPAPPPYESYRRR